MRFHITMKTSTDENTRLMVAVMQQQLREVGIALDIRSFEFATFFADVTHGAFQLYGLRWIGGNEDPDIFEYAFHSAKFPPNGANRGYYSNPKVDALIDQARREVDPSVRKPIYAEVQRILAERSALHRSLVSRQRSGAQQTRAESEVESSGKLRLSAHGGAESLEKRSLMLSLAPGETSQLLDESRSVASKLA